MKWKLCFEIVPIIDYFYPSFKTETQITEPGNIVHWFNWVINSGAQNS